MGDRRIQLGYAKAKAPAGWEIVLRAAFAAILFIFPLVDFFLRDNRSQPLMLLDAAFVLIGFFFIVGIVRLYKR